MARVRVLSSSVSNGRIERLTVAMTNLPNREIDRDTAVRWLKDGHSFIPVVNGQEQPALHLVEGPDDALYVRADGASVAEDSLPA
jgi:hypothetical protein